MYPPAVVLGDGTALFTTEQGVASRVVGDTLITGDQDGLVHGIRYA